jgi:RNA binding activity-knot of a chromodomain
MARILTWLVASLLLLVAGCSRAYDVGDHVMVEWEGNVYPAMIIEIPGPGKVKVHYDGYDEIWDETVPRSRVKGRVEGNVPMPEPPEKVRRTAVEAAKTNQYKIGDRVKVDWHNHYYPALVVGIVGPERYRIHYEGYGNEWDENVGPERVRSK